MLTGKKFESLLWLPLNKDFVHWTKFLFTFSTSWFSTFLSPIRALSGVNICPAALNRRSHAALAGRGVFVRMNRSLIRSHAMTAAVSVDRLNRYSSSCTSPLQLLRFFMKKSSSSSPECSVACSAGAACCMTVSWRLINLMPANRQVVRVPVFTNTKN